eukprot:TRINITY_DN21206_c0_g1_i3.p1 TRINITY_DN21206_c0_g1~~TRINITY_DN21206_c0_g1_i3.p1  ORF type:complete len:114 (-),score=26.97 TRINITY_DN21206_c0_g1_i3:88-399(-)
MGVHQMIVNSLQMCQPEMCTELSSNVFLSGGNTKFNGLPARLRKELAVFPIGDQIRVKTPVHREHSAWIGGSMMASLSTFEDLSVSKLEYEEIGFPVLHRKCF